MANLSAGKPTDSNTITNITIPAPGTAALPIEASKAVRTIMSWSVKVKSKLRACAIKTAATAWYKLVPSILIVAPTGNTKLDTSLSTPTCSSTRSIVTGKVAALLLVEKANNCAGLICFKNQSGFFLVATVTTII
ncbi:MAG: Uncharacterised protein [Formosa sp. Hel3_A1_48]|nr:MAG: Uncharacterised protein [Formosa sp. Hel3_A1_48]